MLVTTQRSDQKVQPLCPEVGLTEDVLRLDALSDNQIYTHSDCMEQDAKFEAITATIVIFSNETNNRLCGISKVCAQ